MVGEIEMKRKQEYPIRWFLTFRALIAGVAFGAVTAVSPVASAQDQLDSADTIDEILVTGKRGSLLQSLEQKRNARSIVDSIASEELGRFPDPNVADSLSHVPGVTVTRTRNGEAQYVNIRGLGPEFSVVTLNNRILATDDTGRNFAFDVIPSEMISGADVWKSAEAKETEGSIGGLINLKSARPLDMPGFHSSWTGTGNYNSLSDETGGKLNGIVSNTFADDTFGLIVGLTYAKGDRRSDDMFDNFYFGVDDGREYDVNEDGSITPDEQNIVMPGSYALGAWATDFQRTGATTTLQWKASDRFVLSADALFTKLESDTVGYTESFYIEEFPGRFTNIVMDGNVITAVDVSDVTMEVVTLDEHRTVDTSMLGLNGAFDVSDRFVINGDVYWSESVRDGGGKDTFVVAGAPGTHSGHYELNNGGLPDYIPNWDGGRSSDDFGNDDFAPHWAFRGGDDVEDKVIGASLDANLGLDFSFVEDANLDFGVVFTGRDKSKTALDNEEAGACNYCGYPYFFGEVGADVVRPFPFNDLFSGDNANVPRSFPIFDIPAYGAGLAASDGLTLTDYLGNDRTFGANESAIWEPVLNPVNSYTIEEDTTATFVQLNLSDERWFANVGLRYIQTDVVSNYSYNSILTITIVDPNVPNPQWIVTRSASAAQTATGDYDKILPTLNVGINLQDDLLLRFAASQTMSRPTLDQMAPLTTDSAQSGVFVMEISGDPGIEPVFADNYDLSLEWYFAEGSLVSAAYFWKDLEGFITTQTTTENIAGEDFRVTRPINGDTAEVQGIELGVKKIFDSGLGLAASYTHTDSKTFVDGSNTGGLVGVPDESYSVTVFYESEKISTHLGFDHTGDSVDDPFSPLGEGYVTTREAYDMMTASFRYHLMDNLTLFVEGYNLLDAINETYVGRPDLPGSIQYSGQTYLFGAVYTF
jgi:iron complex outermembrane recepter protein